MRESDEMKELLAELLDVQREHLAEYRKVTQRGRLSCSTGRVTSGASR